MRRRFTSGAVAVVGVVASIASAAPEYVRHCDGNVLVNGDLDDEDAVRNDCVLDDNHVCVDHGDDSASCEDATAAAACRHSYLDCDFVTVIGSHEMTRDECEADLASNSDRCAINCIAAMSCSLDELDACYLVRCPAPPPPSSSPPPSSCCRVCRSGKACGDSCISVSSSCNTFGGCACNG